MEGQLFWEILPEITVHLNLREEKMETKNYIIFDIKDYKIIFFKHSLIALKITNLIEKICIYRNQQMCLCTIQALIDAPAELIQKIYKKIGLLEENDEKYRHLIQDVKYKSQTKVLGENIDSVQINVINACNCACRYCFAGDGTHGKKDSMDLETIEDIVYFLNKSSNEQKEKNIAIIGGEALLNYKAVKKIIESKGKKNWNIMLTTNGLLLNQENSSFFLENNVSVMVSIDSTSDSVQDWLRPQKNGESNVSSLKKSYFTFFFTNDRKPKVHITITPYNLNLYDICKEFFEMGFYHVHLDFVITTKSDFLFLEKHIEILIMEFEKLTFYLIEELDSGKKISCYPLLNESDRLKKRSPKISKCGALKNMIAISPKGIVYPCDMLMWNDYELGKIRDGIDESKVSKLTKTLSEDKICKLCWARYLCGGQCYGEIIDSLDIKQRNIICSIRRYIAKLQIYIHLNEQEKNRDIN